MRSVCGVGRCARPLTHITVRSRPVLAAALHPNRLIPT